MKYVNTPIIAILGTFCLAPCGFGQGLQILSHHLVNVSFRAAGQLKSSPSRYILKENRLVFNEMNVRLVVLTGPPNDMLSYRVNGRTNPILQFRTGAKIHLLFINMDDDMKHDFRLASGWMKKFDKVGLNFGTGSEILKPRTKTIAHAEELEIALPSFPGKRTYLCTVPGHAQGGMYGKILLK